MTRDPEKFVYAMLDACRFLLDMTAGQTVDRFKSGRAFRSAIERELQIIDEAMIQLRAIACQTVAQISEHERIIGFRHVLVHGYHSLDADIVSFVIQDKLPALRVELERCLGET